MAAGRGAPGNHGVPSGAEAPSTPKHTRPGINSPKMGRAGLCRHQAHRMSPSRPESAPHWPPPGAATTAFTRAKASPPTSAPDGSPSSRFRDWSSRPYERGRGEEWRGPVTETITRTVPTSAPPGTVSVPATAFPAPSHTGLLRCPDDRLRASSAYFTLIGVGVLVAGAMVLTRTEHTVRLNACRPATRIVPRLLGANDCPMACVKPTHCQRSALRPLLGCGSGIPTVRVGERPPKHARAPP